SALDDPFLADALEGYTLTKTPSADLAALQERLQLRIEKDDKQRGIFFISAPWIKVAALVILIAGGGWLMVGLFDKNETELAVGTPVSKVPAVVRREIENDSAPVSADASPQTQAAGPEQKTEDAIGNLPLPTPIAPNPSVAQPPQTPPSVFRQAVPDSIKSEGYTARQTAPSSAPVQGAMAKRQNSTADENSRRDGPVTDTIRNFNVTLKRDESSLAEVIVLKQRSKEFPAARKMTLVIDSLEPAEGWTNFDDYVVSNLKEPEELKTKKTQGEVELSFEVNKNGEPVNISVTKPLCEKCDEEAVRLLKEGPKWKKGKKKGKVKIKFPTAL
ncbi:MAG TPA: energy transducer TonB, partial [Flavisolibacter sp.]|nr:energy transducer TonB [Flavisolibacter sp.]